LQNLSREKKAMVIEGGGQVHTSCPEAISDKGGDEDCVPGQGKGGGTRGPADKRGGRGRTSVTGKLSKQKGSKKECYFSRQKKKHHV